MDVLLRLLQLTFYGLKFSEDDLRRLLETPPGTWAEARRRITSEAALEKIGEPGWCRDRWRRLDEWSRANDIRWVRRGGDDYPEGLCRLSRPPLILSYQGAPVWKSFEMISVVGSREPAGDSIDWMRRHLLPVIETPGLTVVSGGARGIDAFAHELTLLTGKPCVCFLPSGLLHAYPAANAPLFRRIREAGGVLISGFAPDAEMEKGYFHARNRWIAGISSLTFIVEAQRKSGSYLTARMAMEESRAIATLPVSPLAPRGLGNLDLIFDGAHMVRDCADLLALVSSELVAKGCQVLEPS